MKRVLTDLAIMLTLLATGFTGGYLYCQIGVLERLSETLETKKGPIDIIDTYYIATGEKI